MRLVDVFISFLVIFSMLTIVWHHKHFDRPYKDFLVRPSKGFRKTLNQFLQSELTPVSIPESASL